MWGISYPGFYVSAGMIDAHPALKAVSPQAPVTDCYMGDDCSSQRRVHAGGELRLLHGLRQRAAQARAAAAARAVRLRHAQTATSSSCEMGSLGPTPNATACKDKIPTGAAISSTPTYDEFWQARASRRTSRTSRPRCSTVGGWFDAEDLAGPLHTYAAMKADSSKTTNHAGDGPVDPRRLGTRRRRRRWATSISAPKTSRWYPRARSSSRSSCTT